MSAFGGKADMSSTGWCPASGDFRPFVSRIETGLDRKHCCDFEPLSWVVLHTVPRKLFETSVRLTGANDWN